MVYRPRYFNYIVSKLSALATEIELRGKLNYLDLHLHSENFYLFFFNELFGWHLQNMNAFKANSEGIDLIDHGNKIVVQVSATATRQKIEAALAKDLFPYAGYVFKFISISKDADALRGKTYVNPHNLTFDPKTDIHDVASILRFISVLDTDDMGRIYRFIKKELITEIDPVKLESNLAAIITILAKENWNSGGSVVETKPFAIDKKIVFNNLDAARDIIDEYDIHHNRVARVYADYDKQGNNKSLSVMNAIKRFYVTHKAAFSDDALFFKVIECVAERVRESANYAPMPEEELDLCVNILVVDAFILCKIFKNPEGYFNAAA